MRLRATQRLFSSRAAEQLTVPTVVGIVVDMTTSSAHLSTTTPLAARADWDRSPVGTKKFHGPHTTAIRLGCDCTECRHH